MEHALSFEALDLRLGDHAPFLISLTDGPDNELRVVISPAAVGEVGEGNTVDTDILQCNTLHCILSKCRPITPDESTLYDIYFENYIVYQTRNESYASYDAEEIRSGTYLITFEKSKLLESLSTITDAFRSDDGTCYPGDWKHYGIYTQNHVIDVISHCPPVISCIHSCTPTL